MQGLFLGCPKGERYEYISSLIKIKSNKREMRYRLSLSKHYKLFIILYRLL